MKTNDATKKNITKSVNVNFTNDGIQNQIYP